MNEDSIHRVSICLEQMAAGDEQAIASLMPLIYDDLRALARRIQGRDAEQDSLNPTALVHEVYGRLVHHEAHDYEGRRHFMRVAAMAMRQLLADQAREKRALKRGGGAARVTLQEGVAFESGKDLDLIALDEALEGLSKLYPRQARVVELRFLTGLNFEDTAEVLEISVRTAKLDWQMARAWLSRELERQNES